MSNVAALISPQNKNLSDLFIILHRHRALALIVLVIGLLVTALLALFWPPAYRSSATILIEQQEIPTDLVRSTVSTYADQRIQIINQRVMTRANLVEIIRKYDLYAKEQRSDPLEIVVDKMRKDIQMNTVSADVVDPRSGQPTQATIAFTLAYENESPQLAQKVTSELTSLFLNENLQTRRQMASQTSDFLTEETERVNAQISGLEQQFAEFKQNNAGRMPDLAEFNMQLADRTDRELADVEQNLRTLKERRIYLEAQLAQISPRGSLYAESGERILDSQDRLKSLRARYISQSAVYAPDHPDLLRMRKEIASLEDEVGKTGSAIKEMDASLTLAQGELAESRQRYGDGHPTVQRLERQVALLEQALAKQPAVSDTKVTTEADNPAYIQIQAQLQATDGEINALQNRQVSLKERLRNIESRLADAPEVEQKYRALTRDYDNAWAKYNELKAKQMEAKLAESLETERKGERFTLIDPPLLPEKPDKPNRLVIILLGVLLSFTAGISVVAVRAGMDGTIHDARELAAVTGMSPLVSIPYIQTRQDVQKNIRHKWLVGGTAAATVIGVVVGVHFVYMPLDVLWYVVLRRFQF